MAQLFSKSADRIALALLLGLPFYSFRVKQSRWPFCSTRPHTTKRPSDIERLLGGPIEQKLKVAEDGSPVNHVSADSPPFLLIHGLDDQLVPLPHSTDLQARLQRAGVEAKLIIVPGKGHWFLLDKSQLAEVAAFFRRHFGLPTTP